MKWREPMSTGENMRQVDEKAKSLKPNLVTYHKYKEMAGDVYLQGGQRH